jgi:hypothetical protein
MSLALIAAPSSPPAEALLVVAFDDDLNRSKGELLRMLLVLPHPASASASPVRATVRRPAVP